MFDSKKPTAQMLGRWQPWHEGHTALFKKAIASVGQVCIMIRDVQGWEDNPFSATDVADNIIKELQKENFTFNKDYVIIVVHNIVNISYGRGVGYTFTEHDLGDDTHKISATKIRKELREKGEI